MLARCSVCSLGHARQDAHHPTELSMRLKMPSSISFKPIELIDGGFGRHWSFVVGAEGWTYDCKSAAGGERTGRAGARPERGSEHCDGALEAVQL